MTSLNSVNRNRNPENLVRDIAKCTFCLFSTWVYLPPVAVLGNGYSGFGEGSPERKAAIHLQNFFNYIAVRIVLAQLEVALLPFAHLADCSYFFDSIHANLTKKS